MLPMSRLAKIWIRAQPAGVGAPSSHRPGDRPEPEASPVPPRPMASASGRKADRRSSRESPTPPAPASRTSAVSASGGGDSPLRGPAIFRKTDLRAMPVLRQYSFQEHAFPPLPGPEIPSQEGFQILFARSHVHPIACHPILYGIWVTFYVIQCGSLTSGGFRHTINVPAATPVVRKKMR